MEAASGCEIRQRHVDTVHSESGEERYERRPYSEEKRDCDGKIDPFFVLICVLNDSSCAPYASNLNVQQVRTSQVAHKRASIDVHRQQGALDISFHHLLASTDPDPHLAW